MELLNTIESYKIDDLRNEEQVAKGLKATVSAKLPQYGDFFSTLIAKACINSLPDVTNKFDVDNVRVVQILGSSVSDSHYMSGMVVKRNVEGSIESMKNPKIACYSCP